MATALITGTTSGIGYSFSELLASRKYDLILVAKNLSKLEQQRSMLISKYNIKCTILVKNLININETKEVIEYLKDEKININLLINNAGFNECGEFTITKTEAELDILRLTNITLTYLTKEMAKLMKEQGGGKILNLGSTGSFAPFPNDAVYAAAKAYVLTYSRAIGAEAKKYNVIISTLCPGATNTQFATKANIEQTLLFRYFVMSPNTVAKIALKKLEKNQKVIIPGIYNKLLVCCMKILPNSLIEKISPLFFK